MNFFYTFILKIKKLILNICLFLKQYVQYITKWKLRFLILLNSYLFYSLYNIIIKNNLENIIVQKFEIINILLSNLNDLHLDSNYIIYITVLLAVAFFTCVTYYCNRLLCILFSTFIAKYLYSSLKNGMHENFNCFFFVKKKIYQIQPKIVDDITLDSLMDSYSEEAKNKTKFWFSSFFENFDWVYACKVIAIFAVTAVAVTLFLLFITSSNTGSRTSHTSTKLNNNNNNNNNNPQQPTNSNVNTNNDNDFTIERARLTAAEDDIELLKERVGSLNDGYTRTQNLMMSSNTISNRTKEYVDLLKSENRLIQLQLSDLGQTHDLAVEQMICLQNELNGEKLITSENAINLKHDIQNINRRLDNINLEHLSTKNDLTQEITNLKTAVNNLNIKIQDPQGLVAKMDDMTKTYHNAIDGTVYTSNKIDNLAMDVNNLKYCAHVYKKCLADVPVPTSSVEFVLGLLGDKNLPEIDRIAKAAVHSRQVQWTDLSKISFPISKFSQLKNE